MKPTTVSVFGTILLDCKGFAHTEYRPASKNVGTIEFVHGGVGRNVAETLARLTVPTAFITGTDTTAHGKEVIEHLEQAGVIIPYQTPSEARVMGMWMAILNEKGDLVASLSQMPDLSQMKQKVLEHGQEILEKSDHIVLVLDINEEITKQVLRLCEQHKKPVYGLPANMQIVSQHPEVLRGLACFVCNNKEMDVLTKSDFTNASLSEQLEQLQSFVHSAGIKSMIVTCGEHGSIYYDLKTGKLGHQPVLPVEVVDSSGAGDSFFSGAIAALVHGAAIDQACLCGSKVAGWTLTSKESICPDLTEKMNDDETIKSILLNNG